jgi:hypothetical protein
VKKYRKTISIKKRKTPIVHTPEQIALVHSTCAKVVAGTMTRDAAQKLLTDSGIPVLKKKNWVHPQEKSIQ